MIFHVLSLKYNSISIHGTVLLPVAAILSIIFQKGNGHAFLKVWHQIVRSIFKCTYFSKLSKIFDFTLFITLWNVSTKNTCTVDVKTTSFFSHFLLIFNQTGKGQQSSLSRFTKELRNPNFNSFFLLLLLILRKAGAAIRSMSTIFFSMKSPKRTSSLSLITYIPNTSVL